MPKQKRRLTQEVAAARGILSGSLREVPLRDRPGKAVKKGCIMTPPADTAIAAGRFDADLVIGGFIDRLVSVPLGSLLTSGALTARTHVRSRTAQVSGTVTVTAANSGNNYDLDNNTTTADFSTGVTIVSLMVPGVPLKDAIALNLLIDNVSNNGTITSDNTGRCIYSAPAGNGTVTVYLYIAHL